MTKYKISEQILRMIEGDPAISSRPHINDVMLLVEQVANSLLKTEVFKVNMPEGDSIPPNCMIATYDNIPVTVYRNVSQCFLPAIPISLPRNMGVFEIFDELWCPYIPIQAGVYVTAKPHNLLGDQVGYEVYGSQVIFTKNLTPTVNAVTIRLVVTDFSKLSNHDLLPVSADLEAQIVDTVYKMLVGLPPVDRKVDSNNSI